MIDGSNEPFSFGVTVQSVTGATWPALEVAVEDLQNVIGAVSYGAQKSRSITDSEKTAVLVPGEDGANREVAVRYLMQDPDGNKSVVSLGAPILGVFPFATLNTDYVDVPHASVVGDAADLAAWLDANARHPISGLALTVYAIEKVGRNL
jgi:hypothetical protein